MSLKNSTRYESSSSSDDESSDVEELQPAQTEDEAPPQTQDRSDNQKKRKILQNLLQPLKTNNPDRSVSLRFDQQTQSLQLHLAFRGLPTHHPKKNVDHLQSFTEAGMILRRSQTYSHRNGSETNSKKRNLDLKPTITARLKTL